jgi:hypothetical protein
MPELSKRCFVISPIGAQGSAERKHADMTLNAIIRPALAESGTEFSVTRADESSEIGMITDHLISEILESDLLVADLSFLNPNVFYELGIAHAIEKPVIHIAHRDTKLPFDNVGYRAVLFDPTDWQSQVESKKQIAEAARIAVANSSVVSNPISHARGWKRLKSSSDSEQYILAKLVEENSKVKSQLYELVERFDRVNRHLFDHTNPRSENFKVLDMSSPGIDIERIRRARERVKIKLEQRDLKEK